MKICTDVTANILIVQFHHMGFNWFGMISPLLAWCRIFIKTIYKTSHLYPVAWLPGFQHQLYSKLFTRPYLISVGLLQTPVPNVNPFFTAFLILYYCKLDLSAIWYVVLLYVKREFLILIPYQPSVTFLNLVIESCQFWSIHIGSLILSISQRVWLLHSLSHKYLLPQFFSTWIQSATRPMLGLASILIYQSFLSVCRVGTIK